MDTVETEEGWYTTPDGVQLYTKTWRPRGPHKARVVFIHGFSDHCNWYGTLFETLAKNGIKVHAFDQRGWGRSVRKPAQKGLTGPNERTMADITGFIQNIPNGEHLPLFLMGHSMGGGETLVFASTGPKEVVSKIRGFLLESPLIGLSREATPSRLKVVLGRLAAMVAPNMTLVEKLDANSLSRDPAVCKAWLDDPLCHDTASLEGLAALLDRTESLDGGKIVLADGIGEGGKTRVWIGHGTADGACDYNASRRWFDRIQVEDKEFKTYDGWYHRLHNEPEGDDLVFANDVVKWVLDRSHPLEGSQTKSKL